MRTGGHGATDVGRSRRHNEDAFVVDDALGVYAVADGMGGHAAGEVASAKAVEVLQARLAEDARALAAYAEAPEDLQRQTRALRTVEAAFQAASAEVHRLAQARDDRRGMGTTLVVLVRAGRKAVVAHVGDSRAYLLRGGRAHQLTEDHTLVNAQLKQGLITEEEAAQARHRNVITRSVGYQAAVQVDTLVTDLLPGDRFLLCSDGLSAYVRDDEWAAFLGAGASKELPGKLLRLANHRGGRDNVTAVVVEVEAEEVPADRPDVEGRLELLRSIPLFRHLTYKELIQVLSIVRTRGVATGATVVGEGESGDELFVVLRGHLDVIKGGRTVERLAAGSHFGELALLDNAPRAATVRATDEATLLVIDRETFYALLRQDSLLAVKLLWAFLQVLTRRLREAPVPPGRA